MNKRLLSGFVLCLTLSLLLAGCGGNGGFISSSATPFLLIVWLFAVSVVGTLTGCGGESSPTFPPNTSQTTGGSTTTTGNGTTTTTAGTTTGSHQPVPTQLAFTVPPGKAQQNADPNVQAAEPLPAFTVAIEDAQGNVVTGATNAVTISLAPGSPTGAKLSGTLTVNAVNGVATFTNVIVSPAGTGFSLVASSPGLSSATSPSFGVNPLVLNYPGRRDYVTGPETALGSHGSIFGNELWGEQTTQRIASGILTSSGHTDLVVTNWHSNTLSVFLGKGDGTFSAPVNLTNPSFSPQMAVAIGDIDGDGKADIVAGDYYSAYMEIFHGNGDGTFQAPTRVNTWTRGLDILATDFGNGSKDFVVAEFDAISTLGGVVSPIRTGFFSKITGMAIGTFQTGGKPALVISRYAGSAGTIDVLLGNGDGNFAAPVSVATPHKPGGLAVGTLTNGGPSSIVYTDVANSSVDVLVGNGDGTFKAPVNYPVPPSATLTHHNTPIHAAVKLGDINGDGVTDIVVISNDAPGAVSVLLGKGDGTFGAAQNMPTAGAALDVTLGDFNGDQKIDIATVDGTSLTAPFSGPPTGGDIIRPDEAGLISVFLNQGNGTFSQPRALNSGQTALNKTVEADVNGDGNPDLVSINSSNKTVSVMLGNADGTFGSAQTVATLSNAPTGLAAADLNGDGKADIVTTFYSTNKVAVLENQGNGTFTSASYLTLPGPAGNVVIADLNADNKADLLTVNVTGFNPAGNQTLSFFAGNGDGTFKPGLTSGVGYGRNLVVADFNDDGKLDVAFASEFDPDLSYAGHQYLTNLSVLMGNGDGTFKAQTNYTVSASPFALGAADLNGDGFIDLVTTGDIEGDISILLNNGDGTFKVAANMGAGFQPQGLAITDVNLDGIPDVVVAAAQSNNVAVFLGNGDGTLAPATMLGADLGFTSVVAGDFNHDGKPDFIATGNGGNITEFLHL